jgi:hypothetical protein
VTDADDARWLRACLPPDQPEQVARLTFADPLSAVRHGHWIRSYAARRDR